MLREPRMLGIRHLLRSCNELLLRAREQAASGTPPHGATSEHLHSFRPNRTTGGASADSEFRCTQTARQVLL